MFSPGDKFIRHSKYGSVKGVVKSYGCVNTIDTKHSVCSARPYIVSENGNVYNLDGADGRIYKIIKEYTTEECDIIKEKFIKLKNLKNHENTSTY